MCYSAPVSFGLAGVLIVIGAVTIAAIKHKSQLMFASIPLLFAIQQAAEGVVWLALVQSHYTCCSTWAMYVFLCFAFIVWPFWVPLSLWMIEKHRISKKILNALCVLGAVYSSYAIVMMILYKAHANIVGHSIRYDTAVYDYFNIPLYLFPTMLPFFISRVPRVKVFGCAIAGSLLFSYYFLQVTLISVWCFFAAALSVMILWVLQETKNSA